MRLDSLAITNLRAIRRFEVSDVGDFVVVAGQNGSGKSCVFDAIRLLKSVYGGHQLNEYHQWFGEFAVNLQDRGSIGKLFRSPTEPITIRARISFSDSECAFLSAHAERMVHPVAWLQVTGQPIDPWAYTPASAFSQLRHHQTELDDATTLLAAALRRDLSRGFHDVALTIQPSGNLQIEPCLAVEAAFQAYEPAALGLIEYHSASRTYARQSVGGINLDVRAFEDQQRQQRLYNSNNKYQNIKTELASSYLRAMIAASAGEQPSETDLNATLVELFRTFFPDKEYEGVRPQPGGSLEFPVRLATGEVHDIDELSSGEKEILYGYLKLRNSTPANSVILLDEPELHINPSLLHGFTDFYYRRLGLDQGNQLWLVTHSDTLLRQAVGNSNYRVFQMIPATAPDVPSNQAVEVVADDDVERVTIQLVGDLASYRPHGKVVVLEGDSEDGFDVTMIRLLFPEFARRVNLIGGGHKRRVRDLHAALKDAALSAGLKNRFFAIVDKDAGPVLGADGAADVFSWDVYHIENYLLVPSAIRSAVAVLAHSDLFTDDEDVIAELRLCAEELVETLVRERLQSEVNAMFIRAVNIGGDLRAGTPGKALAASVSGSADRIGKLGRSLDEAALEKLAAAHSAEVAAALTDGTWIKTFPGRAILRRFSEKVLKGKVEGDVFRDMVLDKLKDGEVRPETMCFVLDEIASR